MYFLLYRADSFDYDNTVGTGAKRNSFMTIQITPHQWSTSGLSTNINEEAINISLIALQQYQAVILM